MSPTPVVAPPPPPTSVITFDDLPAQPTSSYCIGFVPSGYGGLSWDNFLYKTNVDCGEMYPGDAAGTVSTPNAAFNINGAPATLTPSSGSSFSLVSLYLTSKDLPSITATLQGTKAGTGAVATLTVDLTSSAPTQVSLGAASGFEGVSSIQLSATGTFLVDNLEVLPVVGSGARLLRAHSSGARQ